MCSQDHSAVIMVLHYHSTLTVTCQSCCQVTHLTQRRQLPWLRLHNSIAKIKDLPAFVCGIRTQSVVITHCAKNTYYKTMWHVIESRFNLLQLKSEYVYKMYVRRWEACSLSWPWAVGYAVTVWNPFNFNFMSGQCSQQPVNVWKLAV